MVAVCLAVAAVLGGSSASPTSPPPRTTVDQVKSAGVLTCGGVPRPGLASVDGAGRWSGLEVEVCRAVATAVFGPGGQIAWTSYESDVDFEHARSGGDRIAFLSFAEMAQHNLTGALLPGPTVFVETHDLLVAEASPTKRLVDLAGQGICFIIGTAVENSLESWFRERRLEFVPRPFQEDDEMYDTFAVQRCVALAGEATALAAARRNRGVNNVVARLLPDHLAAFPIVAATSLKDDARWAALVAWTLDTLLNADQRETPDRPGGVSAMTVDGAALGLVPDWQKIVVETVRSYSAIFGRTLGNGSPFRLEQDLNRLRSDGGMFLPPLRN